MRKRIFRIEIMVVVLLLLVTANFLTSMISNSSQAQTSAQANENVITKELPPDLTRDLLNKITYKIKGDYNKEDWTSLYTVFGEYAQAQIDPDAIESSFLSLKAATGKIQTYAYSHHLFLKAEENADWFQIYYKCRFNNGKGIIKISTRTVDTNSEVVGINITLDEL